MKLSKTNAIAILLLMSMLCFAPAVIGSFTSEWGEYQNDADGRGLVGDGTGSWTSTYSAKYDLITSNSDYQAISLKVDESVYIAIATSTHLKVYDSTGNLKDEAVFTNLHSQPIRWNDYIVFSADSSVWFYSFNGSSLSYYTNYTLTPGINETAIRCDYAVTSQDCYLIGDFNTTHSRFMKFDNESADSEIFYSIANWDFDPFQPVLGDLDRDSHSEIMGGCSPDGDDEYSVCVLDTQTGTYLNTFSTDGVSDELTYGAPYNRDIQVIAYNIDGGGALEVIAITSYGLTDTGQRVYILDETGNEECNVQVSSNNPSTTTYVYGAIRTEPSLSLMVHSPGMVDCSNNACTISSILADCSITRSPAVYSAETKNMVVADIRGDSAQEVIVGGYMFDPTDNTSINLSFDDQSRISLVDLDGDGSLDFITTDLTGGSSLFIDDFINSIPTLNNSIQYGGYFGYYNPVCVNTTLTFQAQELSAGVDGNYINDELLDTERLLSDCGLGGDVDNGSFESDNPTFECYYNETGTYAVTLYLQDNSNTADLTQVNTNAIPLLVIDGVPGVSCNVALVESPSDQDIVGGEGILTSDELENTIGLLTGTDTRMKNIIAFSIIIGIAVAGAQLAGIVGFVGAGFMTATLVLFLGLLSPWIYVTVLIMLLVSLLVLKSIMPSNGGNTGGG